MDNVFAALRSNESCQDIFHQSDPSLSPGLDCQGCDQYSRGWCILFPERWLNAALLAECPRSAEEIRLKALEPSAPVDAYSRIFEEAVESLADSYPPDLMTSLRGNSPELAVEIDNVLDRVNEAWGGDLGRFRETVNEWTAVLRGAPLPPCVEKTHTAALVHNYFAPYRNVGISHFRP